MSASKPKLTGWRALKFEPVRTVGELMAVLKQVPADLPLTLNPEEGLKPVLFNVRHHDAHLALEDNDGTWDD